MNILYSILFFFTPLLLSLSNSELFELPKMYFVYLMTTIILFTHLYNYSHGKVVLFRKTNLTIPLLLFIFSQIISTFFSIDRHTSIFGYYSRLNGGLLSTISYSILYFILCIYINPKFQKQIIKFVLISGSLVAIWGILEHFGIDKDFWVQDVQNRVFSTLGQPNWLAAYLNILIPLSINSPLALLFFVCLIFTKSKSGIIACLLILPFCFKKSKIVYFNLIFIICISLSFFLIKKPAETKPPLPNLNITASSDIRKIVWQGAIDLYKQYPIFGTGVETFAYTYYWTRPASHNLTSEWDFLYNKAHNEYINFLATTGTFGFLTYTFLLICAIYLFITKKQFIFLASYLSILITNFAGFSVVVTSLFLFLLPSFVLDQLPQQKSKPQKWIIFPLVLATIYLLKSIIFFYFADIAYAKNDYKTAISLNPYEPIYYSNASLQAAQNKQSNLAINYSNKAISISPTNINILKERAQMFLYLSQKDPSNFEKSIATLKIITQLAPTDAKTYYLIGQFLITVDKIEEAIPFLEKAVELKSNYDDAHFSLAQVFVNQKKYDKAKIHLEKTLEIAPQNDTAKSLLEKINQ
jgi:putative inorganic carbon (hco3(-)) transporter